MFLTVSIILLLAMGFVLAVHIGFRAPRLSNQTTPADMGLPYETITMEGERGCRLSAWWLPAKTRRTITVVVLHGWGANKSLMLPLAQPLVKMGCNLLFIDAHNHGDSENRGVSTMPKFAEDLTSAVAWLKRHKAQKCQEILFLGHSVGAAASLLAASNNRNVNAVISLASFAHPKLVMQRQLRRVNWVPGLVWLVVHYVQWVIGHRLDDIAPIHTASKIAQPLLLVHGDQDQVVPLSDHQKLCEATRFNNKRQCCVLEQTDHASIEKIQDHFREMEHFITYWMMRP
jgi:alpha-beta hydrolase superfamily lysophospholipase